MWKALCDWSQNRFTVLFAVLLLHFYHYFSIIPLKSLNVYFHIIWASKHHKRSGSFEEGYLLHITGFVKKDRVYSSWKEKRNITPHHHSLYPSPGLSITKGSLKAEVICQTRLGKIKNITRRSICIRNKQMKIHL